MLGARVTTPMATRGQQCSHMPPASGNLLVIAELEEVIYPAPLVIALLFKEIFADYNIS